MFCIQANQFILIQFQDYDFTKKIIHLYFILKILLTKDYICYTFVLKTNFK